MKTQIKSLLIIAAALSACAFTSLSAAPKTKPAIAYPVSKVNPLDAPPVTPGSTRREVLEWLGRPTEEVTANFWIYNRYHAADFSPANREGCGFILVTFAGNIVSDLKLANHRAVEIYSASVKTRQKDLVASGK